jgi:hypothetical protein
MNPLLHQIPLRQDAISECHHRFFRLGGIHERRYSLTGQNRHLLPSDRRLSTVVIGPLTFFYHRRPTGPVVLTTDPPPPLLHRPLLFPIGSGLLCPSPLFLIDWAATAPSALLWSAQLGLALSRLWFQRGSGSIRKKRELRCFRWLPLCDFLVAYKLPRSSRVPKKLFLCAFAAACRCLSCALTVVMGSSLTS